MRTLKQTGYFNQGLRTRKFVRVRTAANNDLLLVGTKDALGYDEIASGFDPITRSINPLGGMATVSGMGVRNLIMETRLALCTEADLAPKYDGASSGAGRLLKTGAPLGAYIDTRNATSGEYASPAVVIGRAYNSGAATYSTYRGLLQFTIPADLTTCEDAFLELTGLGLDMPSGETFALVVLPGTWTGLTGGAFNDFTGWAATGNYTITSMLNDTWTTGEYTATNRIRLSAGGRAYIEDCAGTTAKFMLLSFNDAIWSGHSAGPSGNEFVMFQAATAELRLRYNSVTLDNQIMETYLAIEDAAGNVPTSVNDMDLLWSGVVDSYSIGENELDLTGLQNSFKKNRKVPRKLITATEWADCPEENIGKAVPVVYGDFPFTGEHRTGVPAVSVVDPAGGTTLTASYPNAFKGLVVYAKGAARTVLFADTALKSRSAANCIFRWNGAVSALEILPCRATRTADTKGDYSELTPAPNSGYYPDGITANLFRSASAILPGDTPTLSVSNPERAYGEDVSEFVEFSALNDYIDFVFPTQPGVSNIGGFAFIAYGNFTGTVPADMHLKMFEDQRTAPDEAPNWHELTLLDDTPWGDEGIYTGWIARYFYADLTKTKIRLEWQNATDTAYVNRVCAVVPVDAQDDLALYSHGYGRADDGSGTVTGTASALIENPAHVIESIARTEMELAAAEINTASFDTAATALSGQKLAFQLLERADSMDLLDRIGLDSGVILDWDEQDRLRGTVLDASAYFSASGTDTPDPEDIFTDTGEPVAGVFTTHQITGGLKLTQTPIDNVKNDFVLKYRKNYATGEFLEVLTCDKAGCSASDGDLSGTTGAALTALCLASYSRIGTVNTDEYEAEHIRDAVTATRSLQRRVEWLTKRRDIIEFPAGISAAGHDPGDIINVRHDRLQERFGDAVMNRKKWMITDMSIEPDSDLITITAIEVD